MKDELGGKIFTEFALLRPKCIIISQTMTMMIKKQKLLKALS